MEQQENNNNNEKEGKQGNQENQEWGRKTWVIGVKACIAPIGYPLLSLSIAHSLTKSRIWYQTT